MTTKVYLIQLGTCYQCGKSSESMFNPYGDMYFCTPQCRQSYANESKRHEDILANTIKHDKDAFNRVTKK